MNGGGVSTWYTGLVKSKYTEYYVNRLNAVKCIYDMYTIHY